MKLTIPGLKKKSKKGDSGKPDINNNNNNNKDGLPEVTESFHKQPLDELVAQLSTSLENGLDASHAAQLFQKNGPNRIKQKRDNQFLKMCGYFFSGFGTLFLLAAVVCMLAWKPLGSLGGQTSDPVNLALGVLLIIVIFIQAAFNAFQVYLFFSPPNLLKCLIWILALNLGNVKFRIRLADQKIKFT